MRFSQMASVPAQYNPIIFIPHPFFGFICRDAGAWSNGTDSSDFFLSERKNSTRKKAFAQNLRFCAHACSGRSVSLRACVGSSLFSFVKEKTLGRKENPYRLPKNPSPCIR